MHSVPVLGPVGYRNQDHLALSDVFCKRSSCCTVGLEASNNTPLHLRHASVGLPNKKGHDAHGTQKCSVLGGGPQLALRRGWVVAWHQPARAFLAGKRLPLSLKRVFCECTAQDGTWTDEQECVPPANQNPGRWGCSVLRVSRVEWIQG